MSCCKEIDLSPAKEILSRLGTARDACIPILQAVQATYGYIPLKVVDYITTHTEISKRQVFGVASFYGQFRFKPVGRHMVRVCHGTACHVNGAEKIGAAVEEALGIKDKETTPDGKFTLETVACLGCCSLAPVMMIDETAYGRLTRSQVRDIIDDFEDSSSTQETEDE